MTILKDAFELDCKNSTYNVQCEGVLKLVSDICMYARRAQMPISAPNGVHS